jgi:large subunit ribosomal protein L3
MIGVLGRKIGMTRILDHGGDVVPVTVIQAGPVTVTRIRTQGKEGYNAIQIGFEDAKEKHATKPHFKAFEKLQLKPKRHLKEFRLPQNLKPDEFKVGQEISADLFSDGEFVDVQGKTKGKGFQGAVRRWGSKGGPETHGSMYHRRPGSNGCTTFPGRTWRGHHHPGHMGDDTNTVQNLLIVKVLKEDNAILVRGAVPGARNALLVIRKSFKRAKIDLMKLKQRVGAEDKKDAKKAAAKKPAPKK